MNQHLLIIAVALGISTGVAKAQIQLSHSEVVEFFTSYSMQKHVCDVSQIPDDDELQARMKGLDQAATAKGIDTKKAWNDAQGRLKSDPEIANILTMAPLMAASTPNDRRKVYNLCHQLRGLIRGVLVQFRPDPLDKKDF